MSILRNQPSFSQSSPKPMRCPYLGLKDDPETALGYPSIWNCCHNVKPVIPPIEEHQLRVCLTHKYDVCPAFHAGKKRTLPKELRMLEMGKSKHIAIIQWISICLILGFILMGSLVLSGRWTPSLFGKPLFSTPLSPFTLTASVTEIVTQTKEPELPQINSLNTQASSLAVDTVSITQANATQENVCAYSLEMPIGTNNQLVLHKVQSGESMTILAENYETTEIAIDVVNYFLPTPLWAELVVVIPVGATEIPDTPPLKPTPVDYDDTSFDELSEMLAVSVEDIMRFNQLNPSCKSFHGWLLIPAEKIAISP
jgi:hypothetical protein